MVVSRRRRRWEWLNRIVEKSSLSLSTKIRIRWPRKMASAFCAGSRYFPPALPFSTFRVAPLLLLGIHLSLFAPGITTTTSTPQSIFLLRKGRICAVHLPVRGWRRINERRGDKFNRRFIESVADWIKAGKWSKKVLRCAVRFKLLHLGKFGD